jgi:hypothetical protein
MACVMNNWITRFIDTIVNLRYWQKHLPHKNDNDVSTIYIQWMYRAYQHIRSLLPIYFDRTLTHANHYYGFNPSLLLHQQTSTNTSLNKNSSSNSIINDTIDHTDYDSCVVEFLLRHERKFGGPSIAIGVVLDTMHTSNLNIEYGFCLDKDAETLSKSGNIQTLWPAIYLRSTIHTLVPPPPTTSNSSGSLFHTPTWSSGNSHGLSITGGSPFSVLNRKQQPTITSPTATPTSHLKMMSLSSSSLPPLPFMSDVTSTAATTVIHNSNALEYGIVTGTVALWPHNDWETIINVLESENPPSNFVGTGKNTNQMNVEIDDEGDYHVQELIHNNELDLFLTVDSELSTAYIVPLGRYLHLTIMIRKVNDVDDHLPQQQQQRRNKNQVDYIDDIRTFMIDVLAPKLQIATIFSSTFLSQFMVPTKNESSTKVNKTRTSSSKLITQQLFLPTSRIGTSTSSLWDNEQQVQEFLYTIKLHYGLQPKPIPSTSTNNRMSLWTSPRSHPRRLQAIKSQEKKLEINTASVALYFLGPDLVSSFE